MRVKRPIAQEITNPRQVDHQRFVASNVRTDNGVDINYNNNNGVRGRPDQQHVISVWR